VGSTQTFGYTLVS